MTRTLYLDHDNGIAVLVEHVHPASRLVRLVDAGGPGHDGWNRVVRLASYASSDQWARGDFGADPPTRYSRLP